jgi:glutathione synthase/RimK-type ligase-like ATP-grasp enzyme
VSIVLVIGRHDDPHTEAVTRALGQMECEVVCFDTSRDDRIRLGIPGDHPDAQTSFASGLHRLGADSIRAVWLRQKPVVPMAWWSPLQHDAARFAQSEWSNVIQTLEQFVPAARWVNRPESQRRLNYKPAQLTFAKHVGFKVPNTEVTNDPDVVSELIAKYGKVIYKSLSGYIFSDQTAILTSLVTMEHVQKDPESIRRAPGIYQQFVDKSFEVRVTTVGHRCFAALIETPASGPASVDWRHAQFEDVFRVYDIPPEVEARTQRYLSEAGLRYGAFDFIVTPDGEWYFLECNPAGQFLWLENSLGHPISQAIADELAGCN